MKIALLMGGDSTEREVSFMSATCMQNALDSAKYDLIPITIEPDDRRSWIRRLMDVNPDMVLSALHGGLGENGAVQGLLECMGIPYVGSKILSSALCMNKTISKYILRTHHIPVVDDLLLPYGTPLSDHIEKIHRLGLPLVVKPNQGGSSVGVYIVRDWDAFEKAVAEASVYGDDLLVEQFITGREITCGILETATGLVTLPVVDIIASDGFYDYEAKYVSDSTQLVSTGLPDMIRDMVYEIAKRTFTALHCGGYARVDMIVRDEQIYVLEANTLPGMTSHSLFPKAASLADMSYSQLLDALIHFEMTNSEMSL